MAKSWRKNRYRSPQKEEIVKATADFVGRITPPLPVWAPMPPSPQITKGTPGIVNGRVADAPEMFDVSFESDDGKTVRVEVHPEQIQLI